MTANIVVGTCLIVSTFAFARTTQVDTREQPPAITRETLAARLRHQEGLVRSVVCEFELKKSGTPKEMIPLIKKLLQIQGREHEFRKSVGGTEMARESYASTVWRKGTKERQEKKYLDPSCKVSLDYVTAYDGRLVRQWFGDDQPMQGQIGTALSTALRSTSQFNLMVALNEIYGHKQSTIVSEAREFSAEHVTIGGKRHLKVLLRGYSPVGFAGVVLYFDEREFLVQRDIIGPKELSPSKKNEWIASRHLFSDYRRHVAGSGETIWAPYTVVIQDSGGALPDGTFVEFRRETATLKRIEFNVNIPDEKFTIKFPKNARLRILHDVPPSDVPEGTLPPILPGKPPDDDEDNSSSSSSLP